MAVAEGLGVAPMKSVTVVPFGMRCRHHARPACSVPAKHRRRNYRCQFRCHHRRVHAQCSGSSGEGDGGDDLRYNSKFVEAAGVFLPTISRGDNGGGGRSGRDDSAFLGIDWDAAKDPSESAAVLIDKLGPLLTAREWFVTGLSEPSLFSDDFLFKDPDVTVVGIKKYSEGVRKLFDQETARAEVVSIRCSDTRSNAIIVTWRLSGCVSLGGVKIDIKPYIVYTELRLDAAGSGLVDFQQDFFSVPGWDILLSALAPRLRPFLTPPAPPIEELRKIEEAKRARDSATHRGDE